MHNNEDIVKVLRMFAQGLNIRDIVQKFPAYDHAKIVHLLHDLVEELQPKRKHQVVAGQYIANIDGASRGNPGPGALGLVIYDNQGKIISKHKKTLGICTNNFAEYQALVKTLEIAQELGLDKLLIRSDSQLLVRQMQGHYKIKDEKIKTLNHKVQEFLKSFESVEFCHIPRTENQLADQLANEALDEV
ncbi:MAG: ribonuclease HI family protein [bacterium]|nr:ribonuclease HI family protein [bacterium]MDD5756940.1 ribonuclease HI family protein [bacterium]